MLPYVSADQIEKAKILWLSIIHNFKYLENSLRLRVDSNGFIVQQEDNQKENLCQTVLENQLNKNHELSHLIFVVAHEKIKQNGKRHTLSEVSQYWIPRSKSCIKVLYKYIISRKFNLRPLFDYPKLPDLPSLRLNDDATFSGIARMFL